MKSGWQTYRLDELCRQITDGKHGDCKNEHDSGYYFLSAKDVAGGKLQYESARQITEKDFSETHKRTKLETGDILFTNSGTIGRMAIAKENPRTSRTTFQKSVAILKPQESQFEPEFLYYLLSYDNQRLGNLASGTAQKNLLLTDLRRFQVTIPDLPVQRKIVGILSSYDDLIENNTRRIQLMKKMIQMLYQELCGCEGLSEGWTTVCLSDIATVHRGRSYSGSELSDRDGLPFLNLKCIARDGGFRYDGIKRYTGAYKESQTATINDIIMAVTDMTQERRVIARAARVPALNEEKAVYSMDLVKIVPFLDITNEYLHGMLTFSDFPHVVKQRANGTNVLHLNPDQIETFQFRLAPKALRDRYADIVRPVLALSDLLENKNNILRSTRDLLLPRLVSGELTISTLDIDTGAADIASGSTEGANLALA